MKTALVLGLVLLVAVFLCILPAPTAAQPPARACAPMQVPSFTSPASPPTPPPAPGPGLVGVSLPIVVHYMKTVGSSNDVTTRLRPEMLVEYLEESGAVNTIWRQAGVRLYLQRFETCSFTFSDFGLAENTNDEVDSPDRSQEGKQRFRKINEAYNATDLRALDLYVWWGINQNGGYGDRWLDSGPLRAGAAWIDTDCLDNRHVNCDFLLAHEIGHFLGLCHSCNVGQSIPRVECTRCLPASMRRADGSYTLKSCDAVPGARIMRSDNMMLLLPYMVNGTELNLCERRLANSFASRRVAITTNTGGNNLWVAAEWASCRETRSTW